MSISHPRTQSVLSRKVIINTDIVSEMEVVQQGIFEVIACEKAIKIINLLIRMHQGRVEEVVTTMGNVSMKNEL